MAQATVSTELTRVVVLRQGIHKVATCAFKVNTLGLNAILLSRRYGAHAKGFGVIAKELRDFSKTLHEEMAQLNLFGSTLIDLASQQLKLTRQLMLLGQAEAASQGQPLSTAIARKQLNRDQLQSRIGQQHLQIRQSLARTLQDCLYGSVLARSAQIEAAYAGGHGNALTLASLEFTHYIDEILESLSFLEKALEDHA